MTSIEILRGSTRNSAATRYTTSWPDDLLLKPRKGYYYYPGAGGDFSPIHRYADEDVFDFFVYSDCIQNITLNIQDGFEVISVEDIGPGYRNSSLMRWSEYNKFLDENHHWLLRDEGMVERIRIRTPKGRVVQLYYFHTEAVGTARILRDTIGVPKCIGISDNGIPVHFGGDSPLRQIYNRQEPRYLYVSVTAKPWPNYVRVSEMEIQIEHANQIYINGFGNHVLFESARRCNRIQNRVAQ